MNTTNLFTDFEDFDEQSREILTAYQNDFLDLDYFEKQGKDPFEGIRINKTFQEISNEIAMSTPFGKESVFYRELREILTGQIPKL